MKTTTKTPRKVEVITIQIDRPLYDTKDIANLMLKHPRTVKRWWKRLKVYPLVTIGGHRWTRAAVEELLLRWTNHKKTCPNCQNWRNGRASSTG